MHYALNFLMCYLLNRALQNFAQCYVWYKTTDELLGGGAHQPEVLL